MEDEALTQTFYWLTSQIEKHTKAAVSARYSSTRLRHENAADSFRSIIQRLNVPWYLSTGCDASVE